MSLTAMKQISKSKSTMRFLTYWRGGLTSTLKRCVFCLLACILFPLVNLLLELFCLLFADEGEPGKTFF